jgi:hypothetical protein
VLGDDFVWQSKSIDDVEQRVEWKGLSKEVKHYGDVGLSFQRQTGKQLPKLDVNKHDNAVVRPIRLSGLL